MNNFFAKEGDKTMTYAAPAQYQPNNPNELNRSQISQEDMEKLQEIHELINLLFAELTARSPQNVANPYATSGMIPTMPAAPYTHSLFQYAWEMAPYLKPPGY
jgi:hypothetical protein